MRAGRYTDIFPCAELVADSTFSGGRRMARIVRLLVFRLDERLYALHLFQVIRVIRSVDAVPLPGAPEIVLGIIDLQGEIVPLLDIRRRFGFEAREIGPEDQFIIASTSRRTVAMAVDSVKCVTERPAEDIVGAQKILRGLDQIEGAIQLDDDLTLIHDLDRFLSLEEEDAIGQALRMEAGYERQNS
jgi:purine-binding chemotaxis protein CheW